MSSFANLTPISLTASSSTTDEIVESVNRTKLHEFNKFVAELEFDGEDVTTKQEIKIADSSDRDSSDDEEDVSIKYPYQRKDQFEGIEERLEERINNSDNCQEADEELREVQQLIKEEQKKQKVFTVGSVFSCVVCAKSFDTAQQLQAHTDSAHDFSGNKHKCDICGKAYRWLKNLTIHKKLHSVEFQCNLCSLVFQSASNLADHISNRHDEIKHLDPSTDMCCSVCRKWIAEEAFKKHEWYCKNKTEILVKKAAKKALSVPPSPAMSTTSYASFQSLQPGPSYSPMTSPTVSLIDKSCKVCGETFASRQSMLRHVGRKHPELKDDSNVTAVRYVSTESPTHQYACTECGKRVTTRAALTQHRARFHLDVNRHECHICKKSYVLPSELRKHIQRVHEKNAQRESDDIF